MTNDATTPAPGADDDPAAINRAIAEAQGWTCFDKNILGEPNAIDPEGVARFVPDYCGDHAAALSLLETVCRDHDFECQQIAFLYGKWGVILIKYADDDNHLRKWGEADTLPAAIAKSCLAALRAIEGGGATT